jgi:hypothetical protein
LKFYYTDYDDFNVVAVTRMQIFTTSTGICCPRISAVYRTICKHTIEPWMRKYANVSVSRANSIQVPNWGTDGKRVDISFADTGHSAQLRHAYIFESEKLLNSANQVDTF